MGDIAYIATRLERPLYLYKNNSYNGDSDRDLPESTTCFLIVALASLILVLMRSYYYKFNTYSVIISDSNEICDGKKKVFGLDDIPGPKSFLPVIGVLPYFLPFSNSLQQGFEWYKKYPGMVKGIAANKTFVALTSGPLLQQLFKSMDFGHGVKAPVLYDNMKPFITNGVLVSTGKFWQAQRKILMRSQRFQNLKAYVGMLSKHSEIFVGELETLFGDGKPHQINAEINILFLKVICEMITGIYIEDSQEFDSYHLNFEIWKESLIKRLVYPWLLINPVWKLHPMSKRQDKAVSELIEFARRRIVEHKANRKEFYDESVVDDDDHKSSYKSVLDEMLDAGVDENQIVDEVNTMIFAGHETGATAIHFFCFSMALNPDIQELCRQEVDTLFENPDCFINGAIKYEAIQSNLKYVERSILETLRLFPPVFAFLRELKSPLRLEHESNSYELPVGVNILVSPYVMQRDPNIYPDPEKFNPDRFLPEEAAKRHTHSFIPFSAGAKNCLGQKFAMMEMKVVVAYLLRRFVISTTDKMEDIPLLPFTTLTPERNYTFLLKKRK